MPTFRLPTRRSGRVPEHTGGWADFAPLDQLIGYSGPGVKTGRTWVIAADAGTLVRRWGRLIGEPSQEERAKQFENKPGDRHIAKAAKALPGVHGTLPAIESLLDERNNPAAKAKADQQLKIRSPVPYAFRSFDRQWIIPDSRVIDRNRPGLWSEHGKSQVYLTGLMAHSPTSGPAISFSALIPDNDHYRGSFGGSVFPLWEDAAATKSNIAYGGMKALTKQLGAAPKPEDVFAYVAALLANPAYTEKFKSDLVRPGLRVPVTADRKLFDKAATLGRQVIWLHTFGERFNEGRDPGVPKLPKSERPSIPKDGAIPSTPEGFPDTIDYDAAKRRLKIGTGYIENVPREAWAYEC